MATIKKARCADRAVKIDGQVFEDCEFVNTLMVYEGGALPSFVNCRLTNVQLRFNGPAANTAQLIAVWMKTPLASFVESALKAVATPGPVSSAAAATAQQPDVSPLLQAAS